MRERIFQLLLNCTLQWSCTVNRIVTRLSQSLPGGFVRIRYYGFLANRHRNERLEQCRDLLGVTSVPTPTFQETQTSMENSDPSPKTCPVCRRQSLTIIDVVPPAHPLPLRRPHFLIPRTVNSLCFDTS